MDTINLLSIDYSKIDTNDTIKLLLDESSMYMNDKEFISDLILVFFSMFTIKKLSLSEEDESKIDIQNWLNELISDPFDIYKSINNIYDILDIVKTDARMEKHSEKMSRIQKQVENILVLLTPFPRIFVFLVISILFILENLPDELHNYDAIFEFTNRSITVINNIAISNIDKFINGKDFVFDPSILEKESIDSLDPIGIYNIVCDEIQECEFPSDLEIPNIELPSDFEMSNIEFPNDWKIAPCFLEASKNIQEEPIMEQIDIFNLFKEKLESHYLFSTLKRPVECMIM